MGSFCQQKALQVLRRHVEAPELRPDSFRYHYAVVHREGWGQWEAGRPFGGSFVWVSPTRRGWEVEFCPATFTPPSLEEYMAYPWLIGRTQPLYPRFQELLWEGLAACGGWLFQPETSKQGTSGRWLQGATEDERLYCQKSWKEGQEGHRLQYRMNLLQLEQGLQLELRPMTFGPVEWLYALTHQPPPSREYAVFRWNGQWGSSPEGPSRESARQEQSAPKTGQAGEFVIALPEPDSVPKETLP